MQESPQDLLSYTITMGQFRALNSELADHHGDGFEAVVAETPDQALAALQGSHRVEGSHLAIAEAVTDEIQPIAVELIILPSWLHRAAGHITGRQPEPRRIGFVVSAAA